MSSELPVDPSSDSDSSYDEKNAMEDEAALSDVSDADLGGNLGRDPQPAHRVMTRAALAAQVAVKKRGQPGNKRTAQIDVFEGTSWGNFLKVKPKKGNLKREVSGVLGKARFCLWSKKDRFCCPVAVSEPLNTKRVEMSLLPPAAGEEIRELKSRTLAPPLPPKTVEGCRAAVKNSDVVQIEEQVLERGQVVSRPRWVAIGSRDHRRWLALQEEMNAESDQQWAELRRAAKAEREKKRRAVGLKKTKQLSAIDRTHRDWEKHRKQRGGITSEGLLDKADFLSQVEQRKAEMARNMRIDIRLEREKAAGAGGAP